MIRYTFVVIFCDNIGSQYVQGGEKKGHPSLRLTGSTIPLATFVLLHACFFFFPVSLLLHMPLAYVLSGYVYRSSG